MAAVAMGRELDATALMLLDAALLPEDVGQWYGLVCPLGLGVLGDYLEDRGHPGAAACRWAAAEQRSPIRGGQGWWWWNDPDGLVRCEYRNVLPQRWSGSDKLWVGMSPSALLVWRWLPAIPL